MPNVRFGFTTKRVNSTRNSYGSAGQTLSCKLKEPTSIYEPVFQVQGLSGTNFNYCNMGDLYYWIDDIVHVTNDILEVSCHLDPYGTWRDVIKSRGKGFVDFCGDDTYWNKRCDDIRLYPEQMLYESEVGSFKGTTFDGFPSSVTFNTTAGTVILKCMSYYANDGGMYYYAMSFTCLRTMFADLENVFKQSGTFDFDEFAQKTVCSFGGTGSWVDNIIGITWLPIALSTYASLGIHLPTSTQNYIYIGGIECDIPSGEDVYMVTGINYQVTQKSVAKYWESIQTDLPFSKTARWTMMQLVYPGGSQAVDMSMIKDDTPLYWNSCIDLMSGEWCGKLKAGEYDGSPVIAAVSGNMGLDIAGLLSTRGSNEGIAAMGIGAALGLLGGAAMGLATGGSGLALAAGVAEGAVQGAIAGGGIGGAFYNMGLKTPQLSGGLGNGGVGFCCVKPETGQPLTIGKFHLNTSVFLPAAYANDLSGAGQAYIDFCEQQGYPCNQFLEFNDIAEGSYVRCVNASFLGASSLTAIPYKYITQINSALNTTGLYLE